MFKNKNASYNFDMFVISLLKLVCGIFSLFSLLYFTRLLSYDEFALLSLIIVLLTLATQFFGLSFCSAVSLRELSQTSSLNKINLIIKSTNYLINISTLIGLIVFTFILIFLFNIESNVIVLILFLFALQLQNNKNELLLLGLGYKKYSTILNSIRVIWMFLPVLFYLVYNDNFFVNSLLLWILLEIFICFLGLFKLQKYTVFFVKFIDKISFIKSKFTNVLVYFTVSFIIVLMIQFQRLLLQYFEVDSQLISIFQVLSAYFLFIPNIFEQIIHAVYIKDIILKISEDPNEFKISNFVSFKNILYFMVLLIFSYSILGYLYQYIIIIFNKDYVVNSLVILSVFVIYSFLQTIYRLLFQINFASKQDGLQYKLIYTSAFISIIISPVLVYNYDIHGAIIGQLIFPLVYIIFFIINTRCHKNEIYN